MNGTRELWDTTGEIGKRSAAVFAAHKLDVPRTVDDLVQVVSQISGKPVIIERLGDERWERLTALWLAYPDQDVVLVRSTDSPLYQTHCVLHELAHIVYEHPGCADFATPGDVSTFVREGCTVRGRRLEPDTARVTTRHDTFEGEAESLARLLGRSLLRPRYLADEQAFG
ncbi:hypothetical protein [Clavibacter michiganensis]|uniref:IrrE N-terminal-like domain-containing protein n=1 Tax=Clavibacter michiganensis subsp. insidiosus TaxID=33014 RepID=A0A399SS15_9MICO|nr:hypothetical protein [Clavibacter michiganensis]OQJ57042.1 hypothetical protein B5P21_15845 [Clavibacter michiganensis subsp. insidiosus]RIJ44983.1 hypothetical protein DZF93_00800 [Clavibacter michiganensis subsp. insidiosus]RMC83550.1 hypothetical protein CmiCFBP2404_14665 [Clavibacter michiganensis subsp. insidiosus]